MRQHGTRAMYVVERCRCEPCAEANRAHARNWYRNRARARFGIEELIVRRVDATEARDHLLWLRSNGIGLRTVAERTGLSRSSLQEIVTGERRQVAPETADRILAVPRTVASAGCRIDAAPTWRLVDDLLHLGYTLGDISRALGRAHPRGLPIGRTAVQRRTADRIAEIHRAWRDCGVEWHGTAGGYQDRKCRCMQCRGWAAEAKRRRRANARAGKELV